MLFYEKATLLSLGTDKMFVKNSSHKVQSTTKKRPPLDAFNYLFIKFFPVYLLPSPFFVTAYRIINKG